MTLWDAVSLVLGLLTIGGLLCMIGCALSDPPPKVLPPPDHRVNRDYTAERRAHGGNVVPFRRRA